MSLLDAMPLLDAIARPDTKAAAPFV